MSRLIAIVSQKGGVGKTSTAVNLGACLSAIRRKVLLVELDPQCGLAKCFGLDNPGAVHGLLDVLKNRVRPVDAVYAGHNRLPRLSIMPANVHSLDDENEYFKLLQNDMSVLTKALDSLKPYYDFIFLDTPPRLDNPTYAALASADSYMVPVQSEYAAMGTVGRVLRAALEVKRAHNPQLGIFGFLLTMADKNASFTMKVVQEVRGYLKGHVFRTIIPRDSRLAEVPFKKEPIIAYAMDSEGAKAYIRLAREILSAYKM